MTVQIQFRLSDSDAADLQASARAAGCTIVAEYIRKLLGYEARLYPEKRGGKRKPKKSVDPVNA